MTTQPEREPRGTSVGRQEPDDSSTRQTASPSQAAWTSGASSSGYDRFAAAIVVYRQPFSELASFLRELARVTPANGHQVVYLVCNQPDRPPNEIDRLGSYAPGLRLRVLAPGHNTGWTGAINLAAREALAEGFTTLLALNTDVHFLQPAALSTLARALTTHPTAAFVSPGITLWPETNLVWFRGATLLRPMWITRQLGIGRPWQTGRHPTTSVDVGSSCCVMMDIRAFLELGGFWEDLQLYFEDADLAVRARTAGRAWLLVDEPLLAHEKHGNHLSATEAHFFGRNPLLLIARHERGFNRLLGALGHLGASVIYLLRCEDRSARLALIRGVATGLHDAYRLRTSNVDTRAGDRDQSPNPFRQPPPRAPNQMDTKRTPGS